MNRRVLLIGLTASLPLLVVLAMSFGRDPHRVKSPLVGKEAPLFRLRGVAGAPPISLADLRGKPVVVNFWATWCVPCHEEHQILVETAAAMGSSVQFIGVVYDDEEAKILEFLRRNGNSYPTVVDVAGKTAIAYGVYGVPESFFVDAKGKIIAKHEGPLTRELLHEYLSRFKAHLG